MGIALLSENYE